MGLNSVYITVGVAIILVLVTALVGPFFVDWTVYRSTFENYAERALGHKVTVLGDADIRLLPSPAVTFSDVRVGTAEDPLLVVSRFQMRVELPPLLKGEIRVLDMNLERPHLSLSLDEDGRLDWLTGMKGDGAIASVAEDDITFEAITVVDGAVTLVDARTGETHKLDNGNLQVSARTLAGPYKIDGSVSYGDAPYTVRLATGKKQPDGSLRVKGGLVPALVPIELSIDGALTHLDKQPLLEGDFSLSSIVTEENADEAWRTTGSFKAGVEALEIPAFEYRYGPEDRLLGLDGEGRMQIVGDRRFEIRARANQIDLDRLYGGGPQDPVALPDAGEELVALLKSIPVPEMEGVIALDVPAIVAGGGLVQDVRLDLETMESGWRIARLAGRAPGRTVFATQGDLSVAAAPSYRGNLSISSDQPGAFSAWLRQSETTATAIQPVSLEGRLNLVPDGSALDNFRLTLSGSEARGGLSYRKPRSGNPVFSLSLDADTLDLDELERLAGLFERPEEAGALDVSLRVRAKQVDVRGVAGEGLSLEAEYSAGGLRIDRLFAEDLAGSRIDVSGRVEDLLTAPRGDLEGTLDASDLDGLVAVLEGILPDSGLLDRLEQASDYLVPARFEAKLQASAQGDRSELTLLLDGFAGGVDTRFDGSFRGRTDAWHEADLDAALTLTGPDGGQILRQLGFDILPVDDLGSGEVRISAQGRAEDGLDVTLTAVAGETNLGADGQLRLAPDTEPRYSFEVTALVPDLAPFALLGGRVMPVMAGDIEADLRFDLTGTGADISVTNLAGSVAGIAVDGALEGNLVPTAGEANRRLKGRLRADALDLRYLSEAILGPDLWFSAGDGSSIWPTASFGRPLFSDTDLTVEVETGRLVIDGEHALEGVRSEVRLTPTMLRFDGVNGTFAGGQVSGALAFRRSGAEASVTGRFKLDDADLQSLTWDRDGRAVATGVASMALDFSGAGRSIAVIVSGLSGGGTFVVRDGELRGLNPQAFSQVIRAADAGLDLRDEKIRELFVSHMRAGSLGFERLEGSISIVGGRASARNVVVDSERAAIFGSAELDFNTWDLDGDFSLKVDPGENAVTGAEPQVGLLFSGPVEAPERRIDIAPFTAYLTLRAFEQEVERVEKLQDEILERDRLLREIKRQREDRARRERQAQEAADQAAEEAANPTPDADSAGNETGTSGAGDDAASTDDAAAASPSEARGSDSPDQDSDASGARLIDPADFANRIRSAIDRAPNVQSDSERSPEGSGEAAPAQDVGPSEPRTDRDPDEPANDNETASLPPLDAPQSVEDLLAREIGLSEEALGEGPLDLSPNDSLSTGSTSVETETAPRQAAPVRRRQPAPVEPQPRYRMLPNGLVVEIPNN